MSDATSHFDSAGLDQRLADAARSGDSPTLALLLDAHPDKLGVRIAPYDATLLHVAAQAGQLDAIDLLLRRGADVNAREHGDNTYAMHWAAAAGRLDIVQRLADAGGDVVGAGDDHALDVIGWATTWDGCDDAAHRAVVDLLLSRGARHNIWSAIAMNDPDAVRRVVAVHPAALEQPQSHNENFRPPLHFAVGRDSPGMVKLLIDLGVDPRGTDAAGYTASIHASSPDADRPVLEAIRERGASIDLFTALALGDRDLAARLLRESPSSTERGGANAGVLHLMVKRNDLASVRWLLERGVNPNALWPHWDAEVTPLHLAALHANVEIARALLDAGADPTIRDSKHDSDALGWAQFFGRREMVRMLEGSS